MTDDGTHNSHVAPRWKWFGFRKLAHAGADPTGYILYLQAPSRQIAEYGARMQFGPSVQCCFSGVSGIPQSSLRNFGAVKVNANGQSYVLDCYREDRP